MDSSFVPREEVEFSSLYRTFLTSETPLPLLCFDSRALGGVGEVPRCRLPFPPERSGYSWLTRLDRARETLPRAVFRPTRPKLYGRNQSSGQNNSSNANVTVLALEIPQKRGRGRPKKESTVLVDAAALNRNSFFVKRAYRPESDEPGTSSGVHTVENYTLHGHGGADVNVNEIGILRPEHHYIRIGSRDGTSNGFDNACEYDLDNQDVEWLKLVRGMSDEMNLLDENVLERIIEELERGWDVLTRPIRQLQQRKEASQFPEEIPCEICGDCDTSNCNVIVLCDDCDLAVHQECYGVPHIPEGPWLCRPCGEKRLHRGVSAKCLLCPWPGGALRKTSDHRWVHSLCARMVPETSITFCPSDPYDLVDTCTLHQDRAKLRCVLCRCTDQNSGFPIQCSSKMCHVAFHAMCARSAGWKLEYSTQKAYCPKHVNESVLTNEGETIEGGKDVINTYNSNNNSLNNSHSHSHDLLPLSPTKSKFPLVVIGSECPLHVARAEKLRLGTFAPNVLIKQICANEAVFRASALPLTMRSGVVSRVARYWVLKREARRGTFLLKSLQLDEPTWQQQQSDALSEAALTREFHAKLKVRNWLHCLRTQLRCVCVREGAKLASVAASLEIFHLLSSPFTRILERFLRLLQSQCDPSNYFALPVPVDLFPDYPMLVANPMDFSTMLRNLAADEACGEPANWFYPSLPHFIADLRLIWQNSRLYNTKTSVFYQAADRLEAAATAQLPGIHRLLLSNGLAGPFDILSPVQPAESSISTTSFDFNTPIDDWILPDPSPVRFPKTSITPIAGVPSIKDRFSGGLGPAAHLKRRGRPPKRRDEAGASIESLDEEGNVTSPPSTVASSIAPIIKRKKARGRPRKNPVIDE